MMLAESNPYSTLWNKYRPVILQLMSAAVENGPQQYKLFSVGTATIFCPERTMNLDLNSVFGS